MSTKFVGKFQQVEHDNFDDFMKELGKYSKQLIV